MSTYAYNSQKRFQEVKADPAFIDFIKFWAERHVTRPIQGFEQMSGANGGQITYSEQMFQTHHQIIQVACHFYDRGKSLKEILNILTYFKR